ncbi:MAG: hypothetical protein MJE68_13410 [Proteobacteria bacterium]|nr:hypothetical protein [Pseudomonadota bacterium]
MPQVIAKGACVGEATPVALVDLIDCLNDEIESAEPPEAVDVRRVDDDGEAPARQKALLDLIPKAESLSAQQEDQLHQLLADHHRAFSLDKFDRGETDLLEMQIDTADSPPVK